MSEDKSVLSLSPEGVASALKAGQITIAVIGLGRIGLPTATLFADAGAKVIGLDVNPAVVEDTNAGKCRFRDEPNLEDLVKKVVSEGKLKATTDARDAISGADFIIMCIPTPVDATKTPDYSQVRAVSQTIASSIRRGSVIIVESTVGPGIVEDTVGPIVESSSKLKVGTDFGLASCPERADPGNAVSNMKTVPRIVGGINEQSLEVVAALYQASFGVQIVKLSDPKTANAVKLTENLFRDVNIALANEFALLFEKLGIDALEVIQACATKYNFIAHYPGPGVGGPCLPSNSYYLIVEGMRTGNIPYLIRMGREINDRMPDHVVELISEGLNEVGKTIRGSKIAVLGIAYKPDVKDVQLTPMDRICKRLVEMDALLNIYDPMFAGETALGFEVEKSLTDAIRGADCIVIGTAHKEFKNLNLDRISRLVRGDAAIVDSRNVVDPEKARQAGFAYRGVGRVAKRLHNRPKHLEAVAPRRREVTA